MLSPLALVAFFLTATEPPAPVVEYGCAVQVRDAEGNLHVERAPDLKIIEYGEKTRFVALQAESGTPVAVECARSSVVPQPGDHQVVDAGYPFYISAGGRMAVLEFRN